MTKAFIFTTNDHSSAVGVFDNGEYTMRIEVLKKQGYDSYTFTVDGRSNGLSRQSAQEVWWDAGEMLGAHTVVVDKKYLKVNYPDINLTKTVRPRKVKQDGVEEHTHVIRK